MFHGTDFGILLSLKQYLKFPQCFVPFQNLRLAEAMSFRPGDGGQCPIMGSLNKEKRRFSVILNRCFRGSKLCTSVLVFFCMQTLLETGDIGTSWETVGERMRVFGRYNLLYISHL